MARRRLKRVSRSVRSAPRRTKRRYGQVKKVNPIQLDAMVYGAGRGYMSNLISKYTQNVPILNISDEVALGVANYFIAKKSKGMLKNIALKGLVVENARAGETALSLLTGGSRNESGSSQYLYG